MTKKAYGGRKRKGGVELTRSLRLFARCLKGERDGGKEEGEEEETEEARRKEGEEGGGEEGEEEAGEEEGAVVAVVAEPVGWCVLGNIGWVGERKPLSSAGGPLTFPFTSSKRHPLKLNVDRSLLSSARCWH